MNPSRSNAAYDSVVAAVVEDHHQAVERRVADAAVVQLDELRRVGAGRVGVDLVDDHVGRAGGGGFAVVNEKVKSDAI